MHETACMRGLETESSEDCKMKSVWRQEQPEDIKESTLDDRASKMTKKHCKKQRRKRNKRGCRNVPDGLHIHGSLSDEKNELHG